MNKYAIISSNTNLDYAPFLPLTSLFWRSVGYKTICLLTNDFASRPNKAMMDYIVSCLLHQKGVVIHTVGEIDGFKSSTISQVSRLVAASVPVEDDAYLLTGDVDMLPLSPSWFNQQDFGANFHVFCADVYRSPAEKHYQMCYLGGARNVWKSLMDIGDGCLDIELVRLLKGWPDGWFVDEAILAEKMKVWPSWEACQLISRGYPPGGYAPNRLDRGCWKKPEDISTLIDCHSARPLVANWPMISLLVDHFLPADLCKLAHSYVQGLKAAMV